MPVHLGMSLALFQGIVQIRLMVEPEHQGKAYHSQQGGYPDPEPKLFLHVSNNSRSCHCGMCLKLTRILHEGGPADGDQALAVTGMMEARTSESIASIG